MKWEGAVPFEGEGVGFEYQSCRHGNGLDSVRRGEREITELGNLFLF